MLWSSKIYLPVLPLTHIYSKRLDVVRFIYTMLMYTGEQLKTFGAKNGQHLKNR